MRNESTDRCQRVDRCPTAGTPAKGTCQGLQRCTAAVTAARSFTKDNRSKHALDPIRKSMLRRCDTKSSYYQAGIAVHPEWIRDPWAFFEYVETAMPPRPLDEYVTVGGRRMRRYTLDRIDNDKDYEPGNLQWLDRADQNRNRGHEAAAWERGWRNRVSCLCDPLWRESCSCEAARCWQVTGRAPEERDDAEPWPVSSGGTPERSVGPSMVLGQIIGQVLQTADFSAVPVGQHDTVWFDEPRPLTSQADPDLAGLLQLAPAVDFADLLADEQSSTLNDVLDSECHASERPSAQ